MSFLAPLMNGLKSCISNVTRPVKSVVSRVSHNVENKSIASQKLNLASERKLDQYKSLCSVQLNGNSTYALIDSGNLLVNVISEKFAKKIFGENIEKYIQPLEGYKYIGTAEQGGKLKVLGMVIQPIDLRFHGSKVRFKTRPLVLQGLNMAVNISGPFLALHKVDQLHSRGSLKIRNQLIPLIPYGNEQRKAIKQVTAVVPVAKEATHVETVTTARAKTSTIADVIRHVYTAEDKIIPARSIGYLKLKIPDITKGKIPAGEGMLTSASKFADKIDGHPTLAAIIKTNREGFAYTSILNSKDEEIKIKTGLVFGEYRPKQLLNLNTLNALQPDEAEERKPETEREKIAWLRKEFHLSDAPWLKDKQKDQEAALQLLLKYYKIFSHNDEYGHTNLVQHEIHTQDVPPIRCKGRPINPVMQEKLKEQMDTWKRQGVIEPSSSPWSFGLLPVPKKNGKVRWVIDYRKLNDITLKDSYPLPNIEDNLARLSKSKVFSAIDGTGAYHVISIRPEDRSKTAFHTPFGLYQFRQMPFGLCNAPATYSRLVQKVLEDIPTSIALPYLDDTCIHTPSVKEHLQALELVFQAHEKAGLMLQPSKCQLFQKEVEYLGHLITKDGIKPISTYVEMVKNWPIPTTIKELRTFLGKATYYRKFIPNYSQMSGPLYSLLNKEAQEKMTSDKLVFDEKGLVAIQTIKDALTQAPLLAYPDFKSEEPFILDTDWSKDPGAIGAVLSQKQNGEERVICYGARKLTKTEANYSSNKGELLAVIHFMRHWKYYFQHRPFILRTDHQALQWIRTMEEPKGMILRWLETLGNNNFTIQFRDGKKHGNADALSRSEHARVPTKTEEKEAEEEAVMSINNILYPDQISSADLQQYQESDPELKQVIAWVRNKTRPERKDLRAEGTDLKQYAALFETLYLNEAGVLYRKAQENEFFEQDRLCLPTALQPLTIKTCHEMVGGHMGINTTQNRILTRFYFPRMHKAVENYISQCLTCQRKAGRIKDQRHTLVSIQEGKPFQKISIDFVGPLRASSKGNNFLLTVKDCFTRWIEAFPTKDITAQNVARLLEKHIFSRHGIPEQIHSDQGTQFTSEAFKEICDILNINKTHTPSYNPKSNPVERSHRDMNNILRALTAEVGQDWEELLPTCLLALRTARHRYTGVTPFYALYGREANLPLDLIYENKNEKRGHTTVHGQALEKRMQTIYRYMRKVIKASIERSRINYSGKLQGQPLKENDLVWLFTPRVNTKIGKKLTTYWTGPWKIIKRISDVLFTIRIEGEWNKRIFEIVASIDRLKLYKYDPDAYPLQLNLRREDVLLSDEFLEQGVQDPDSLPQFHPPAQQIILQYPTTGEIIDDIDGMDPPLPPKRGRGRPPRNPGGGQNDPGPPPDNPPPPPPNLFFPPLPRPDEVEEVEMGEMNNDEVIQDEIMNEQVDQNEMMEEQVNRDDQIGHGGMDIPEENAAVRWQRRRLGLDQNIPIQIEEIEDNIPQELEPEIQFPPSPPPPDIIDREVIIEPIPELPIEEPPVRIPTLTPPARQITPSTETSEVPKITGKKRTLSPSPTQTEVISRMLRPLIRSQTKKQEKLSQQLRRLSGQEKWLKEQSNVSMQPQVGSEYAPSAPPLEEEGVEENPEQRGEKEKPKSPEIPLSKPTGTIPKQNWFKRVISRSAPENKTNAKTEHTPRPHRVVLAEALGITSDTSTPAVKQAPRQRRLSMKFDLPATTTVATDPEARQVERIRAGADVNQELEKLDRVVQNTPKTMEKSRPHVTSSDDDTPDLENRPNYFKVAKSRVEDDVTRHQPHSTKRSRGRPRKQGVSGPTLKTGMNRTLYTKRVRSPPSPHTQRRRSQRLIERTGETDEISPPHKIERSSSVRPSPKEELESSAEVTSESFDSSEQ